MQPPDTLVRPTPDVHGGAQVERNQAAIALLRSWIEEGDATEQRETGTYLLRVLAEDDIVIGHRSHGDPA